MDNDREFFRLEKHELDSPLWAKIKSQLEWELDRLRELNDGDKNPIDTANLRGRIKQLKIFLTFGTDREAEEYVTRE